MCPTPNGFCWCKFCQWIRDLLPMKLPRTVYHLKTVREAAAFAGNRQSAKHETTSLQSLSKPIFLINCFPCSELFRFPMEIAIFQKEFTRFYLLFIAIPFRFVEHAEKMVSLCKMSPFSSRQTTLQPVLYNIGQCKIRFSR